MIRFIKELNGLGCDSSVHPSPRPVQIVDIATKDGTITKAARCQNCFFTVSFDSVKALKVGQTPANQAALKGV